MSWRVSSRIHVERSDSPCWYVEEPGLQITSLTALDRIYIDLELQLFS